MKSKVVPQSVPSLLDIDLRATIADIIKVANKKEIDPSKLPKKLLKARNLWQNCDVTKLSKAAVIYKITQTMKLIHEHFSNLDEGALYLKYITQTSAFANNMITFADNPPLALQHVMQEFCQCVELISQQPEREKREIAFYDFPPVVTDLHCLPGTSERINKTIQNLKFSKGQQDIFAEHDLVLAEMMARVKYYVPEIKNVHISSYLTYALNLESSNSIKSHDGFYFTPEADIPSCRMWEILRGYREELSERITDSLSSEVDTTFPRVRRVVNIEYQEIAAVIKSLNDTESFNEKEAKRLDVLLAPLTYEDLKVFGIVDVRKIEEAVKLVRLEDSEQKRITQLVIDNYVEIKKVIEAQNNYGKYTKTAEEERLDNLLKPLKCESFKEFVICLPEKMDEQIRQKLLEKLSAFPILEKAKKRTKSENQDHIDAIRDYSVLLSDKAINHLAPLLQSKSEEDRVCAIEALWVLGERFNGNSPAIFLELLESLAQKIEVPEIHRTEQRGKKQKKNVKDNWFSPDRSIQGWFVGLKNLFLPTREVRLLEEAESPSFNDGDKVLKLLSFFQRTEPEAHKFKINRILKRYRAYQYNEYENDAERPRYDGLRESKDNLGNLIRFGHSANLIIERINKFPNEVDGLLAIHASYLVVHPEREEIFKVLKGRKESLTAKFSETSIKLLTKYNDAELCKYVLANLVGLNFEKNQLKGVLSQSLLDAVRNGNRELVSLFLDKGADPAALNDDGHNVLMIAASEGREQVMQLLLDTIKLKYPKTESSISEDGDSSYMGILNRRGIDRLSTEMLFENPRIRDVDYFNTLMFAAKNGNPKIVGMLIDAGMDMNLVNKQLPSRRNALMIAAYDGCDGVVKVLVERGVSMDVLDKNGNDALMIAVLSGYADVAKELVKAKNINLNRINVQDGFTPLASAVSQGKITLAKILLESGAMTDNDKDYVSLPNGISRVVPLREAAREGNVEMVKLLLMYGADPSRVAKSGDLTALQLTKNKEIKSILQPMQDLQNLLDKIPALKGRIIVRVHFDEKDVAKPFLVARNENENILSLLKAAAESFSAKASKSSSVLKALTMQGSISEDPTQLSNEVKINRAFNDPGLRLGREGLFSGMPTMVGAS